MERYTYFDGGKWRLKIGDTEYSGDWVDRLAAYEDTGLKPEDMKRAVAMPNEAWRTLWIIPLAALVFALSCVGAALDEENRKRPPRKRGGRRK